MLRWAVRAYFSEQKFRRLNTQAHIFIERLAECRTSGKEKCNPTIEPLVCHVSMLSLEVESCSAATQVTSQEAVEEAVVACVTRAQARMHEKNNMEFDSHD